MGRISIVSASFHRGIRVKPAHDKLVFASERFLIFPGVKGSHLLVLPSHGREFVMKPTVAILFFQKQYHGLEIFFFKTFYCNRKHFLKGVS